MRIFSILVCFFCLSLTACMGSSPDKPLDPASSSAQVEVQKDKIEIPLGMSVSQVLKLLGTADSTESIGGGHEIWRYSSKKAAYVYASKDSGIQALVVGNYIREPQLDSPGQAILLSVVFDSAKKVANFNFAIMGF